jgi:hypothetical protein
MTLRDEILADPACATALAARDCAEMARVRSIGRTRPNAREIGNGTILETLGIAAGNVFLDAINTNADFRYVKPLIESGRLQIGKTLVQATVQSMVPAVLTQAQADALCALGKEPDPLTQQEVGEALYNIDGSLK